MSNQGPRYSVASVVYNEAEVVSESVKSIHDELSGYDIEHVVVDGGSTDGTQKILKDLSDKHPIRLITAEETDTIGEDRNISIKECRGKYIINEIDLDDRFVNLGRFLETYHKIESQGTEKPFLYGFKAVIAHRDFWNENPYPEIRRAEDKLPRIVAAENNKFYRWTGEPVCVDLDEDGRWTGIRKDLQTRIGEFRCGMSALSTVKWDMSRDLSMKRKGFRMLSMPLAWAIAEIRGRESRDVDRREYESNKREVSPVILNQ